MEKVLIVNLPFESYRKGDIISDAELVTEILADNHRRNNVQPFMRPVYVPESKPAPSTPLPTVSPVDEK